MYVHQKGDHISISRRVNDEWLKGTLNGHSGMFPISYVELTDPLPEISSFDQDIRKVIAVFSFKPECWEDLSIQVIIRTSLYPGLSNKVNFILFFF